MACSLQTSPSKPQDNITVVWTLLRSISWNEGVVEEELHVEQQVPQLAKEQADVEGMEMEKQDDVQEQAICNIQSY